MNQRECIPEPEDDPYGMEANLHKHVICKKNPGHRDFIPVRDFYIEHLPERYRDGRIVEAIKAGSECCVHIKARNISKHRPECFPKSMDPYPFYIPGGGSRVRTGSGFVYYAEKCGIGSEVEPHTTCFCEKCLTSPNPERSYWTFQIATAAHVVYDGEETREAEFRFHFDSGDRVSSITTTGGRFVESNIEGDFCRIRVPVHDEDLGRRMKSATDYYSINRKLVDWGDLVVIASHPHGISKHITVGERVKMGKRRDGGKCCVYSTSTCPGSSGSLVMGGKNWDEGRRYWDWRGGNHCEALGDGTNRSGSWWWYCID